ncbi:uncharacterized protein METZ01_LOCUS67591 [marine metagenome]|uniref:Uncharacterized protein n=1 Tax=marine metagenome TaxID=408172 RepID=A0A381TIZ1_9ZZZZ
MVFRTTTQVIWCAGTWVTSTAFTITLYVIASHFRFLFVRLNHMSRIWSPL